MVVTQFGHQGCRLQTGDSVINGLQDWKQARRCETHQFPLEAFFGLKCEPDVKRVG